jgi:hypothetical protein
MNIFSEKGKEILRQICVAKVVNICRREALRELMEEQRKQQNFEDNDDYIWGGLQ